jgi:hypothetical protein
VERKPSRIEVDGAEAEVTGMDSPAGFVLFLPRGQHVVAVRE